MFSELEDMAAQKLRAGNTYFNGTEKWALGTGA